MTQKVDNNNTEINSQLNIGDNNGNIYLSPKTRFSKRFEKLNKEVVENERYEGVMDSLVHYLTKLDGVDMPTKMVDGGFEDKAILEATRKKDKYAKKQEKNKYFESAQWIDSQLFAKIKMDFETHVELPLVNKGASKEEILCAVVEKVVKPVLELINVEGENDGVLNYDADDVYGMVYYLTGKCHLNWKNYGNSI